MSSKAIERSTTIDIMEPCPAWRTTLPRRRTVCRAAARAALAAAPVDRAATSSGAELSIVLGDDALLRRLNRQWRGKDTPTNVLAFPANAGEPPSGGFPGAVPRLLGDVILAFETVAGEAAAQGKTVDDHLAHLVVHGVLHLLGFDHEEAAAALRMETLETALLAGMGIADPYRSSVPPLRARHG